MNATATDTNETKTEKPAETIVDAVFDMGEAWASYGLKVSRIALLTSARTLKHAAHALDVLSKSIEKKDGEVVDVEADS